MEWKSGISQIPRGMAEKRRKCGIILPKAEWLACLRSVYEMSALQDRSGAAQNGDNRHMEQ